MKKLLLLLCAAGLMLGCTATPPPALPPPAPSYAPAPRPPSVPPYAPAPQPYSSAPPPQTAPSVFLDSIYYDKTLFYAGLGGACDYSVEGELVAGMIPHHLLASDMIAGFFAMAAQQPAYDGILIVSPSHFPENCTGMVVTAQAGWSTPFGAVQPYTKLVDSLLADTAIGAENNPAAVELDHGAAGLVPFVKYYFPDTPLAVCLVQGKLPHERLSAVWSVIEAERQSANILVISSADCSHYLMPQAAAEHDKQTIEAIEAGQTERIFLFGDENIDSPQSVNTFLTVAAQAQAAVTRLDHSSSDKKLPHAITSPIYNEGTTTYLVYAAARS